MVVKYLSMSDHVRKAPRSFWQTRVMEFWRARGSASSNHLLVPKRMALAWGSRSVTGSSRLMGGQSNFSQFAKKGQASASFCQQEKVREVQDFTCRRRTDDSPLLRRNPATGGI